MAADKDHIAIDDLVRWIIEKDGSHKSHEEDVRASVELAIFKVVRELSHRIVNLQQVVDLWQEREKERNRNNADKLGS